MMCTTGMPGFLSTPPVWVATLQDGTAPALDDTVSIHATRVGGDLDLRRRGFGNAVSIHATRVGGDSKSAQKWIHFCAKV